MFEMGSTDPRITAKAAVSHAKDYGNDIVILDTAGRLQIDSELMSELTDIKEITSPSEIILVIDAMTGQEAVNVARSFDETLSIDSVILTKLDSDTRGGAALSVLAATGKPIKFVGTGEKLDDFEPFHPERMASRILGMGDVLSLIEKAQSTIDENEAERLAGRMLEGSFDLNDLLEQVRKLKSMGSMRGLIKMLPGANKIDESTIDEKLPQRMEAIILSMTKEERSKPSLINPKRKRRIAAGSGTRVEDVNRLLRQYEQMRETMKRLKAGGSKRRRGAKGVPGGLSPELMKEISKLS